MAKAASDGDLYEAVILSSLPPSLTPPPKCRFLGIDVGFFESEYNVFSSVFNELLRLSFSSAPEFASARARLNDALLFESEAHASQFLELRDALRKSGADLEDGVCYPLAIFGEERCG